MANKYGISINNQAGMAAKNNAYHRGRRK